MIVPAKAQYLHATDNAPIKAPRNYYFRPFHIQDPPKKFVSFNLFIEKMIE